MKTGMCVGNRANHGTLLTQSEAGESPTSFEYTG